MVDDEDAAEDVEEDLLDLDSENEDSMQVVSAPALQNVSNVYGHC